MNDLKSQLPDPAGNRSQSGVDAAMQSLASSITAIPREAESPLRASRRNSRRAFTLVAATAACAVAALIGVTQLVGGSGTGSAWAAADIALANNTPLLLIQAPGWKVSTFNQYENGNKSGGMEFNNAGAHRKAMLAWQNKGHFSSLRKMVSRRAEELPTTTVDGHPAQVFRQHSTGGGPLWTGNTALWVAGKYVLTIQNQYRGAPSKLEDDRFAKLLSQLKTVSADALLAGLPKDYLLPSKLPAAATEILADVPLPPGFSSEPVLTNLESATHEVLAERLIIRAECGWIKGWVAARKHGDKHEMDRIANTLAPYRSWRYARWSGGPKGQTSYVGAGWVEALKHGGRMNFGYGDMRDIAKIYRSWMGCDLY
jgi:hypothetical protein